MRSLLPELCSRPVPQSCPFREPDQFFSQFYTFQARHWRTLPCLFLTHCLALQEQAFDAGPSAQKQCSSGGWKEHGSHLDGGRAKAAGRTIRGVAEALRLPSRQKRYGFPSPGHLCALLRAQSWGGFPLLQRRVLLHPA
jgi:hypothetical protein